MTDEFTGALQHWRGPCPHCGTVVKFESCEGYAGPWAWSLQGTPALPGAAMFAVKAHRREDGAQVWVVSATCPSCERAVISMTHIEGPRESSTRRAWFAWPEGVSRAPVSTAVPARIAMDYREAVAVLPASPSASAALSRRCLQGMLRAQGFEQKSLADQIAAAIPTLPKYLQHDVDVIRVIGNNAAHPSHSDVAHAIVDVEPGEAEWSVELIEELLDFYYTRPEDSARRKKALNERLIAQGKKPLG